MSFLPSIKKLPLTKSPAYRSLQTVGSLLLTNSDFRIFLSDLNVIAREVFKDSAFTLSQVAKEVGEKIEPSAEEQQAVARPGADDGPAPSHEELQNQVVDASKVITNGALKVAEEARKSAADKISGDEKETLLNRLQQAVSKLRKRPDYSDSVSTISLLLKRYAKAYSRAVQDTVQVAQEDVSTNPELDRALKNYWQFLTSFGDRNEWEQLEKRFKKVLDHRQNDPEFEHLMNDAGNSVEKLLTDPDFLHHADDKFKELREKARNVGSESSLRQDIDEFLSQAQRTLESVIRDEDVNKMLTTSTRILSTLSPGNNYLNSDLVADSVNVFVPLLIKMIQYVPIPRVEVSTPDIDLLLENLILEPGHTVNQSSFLPYRLRVETFSDVEIRKARTRTTSSVSTTVTIKLDGLSLRATDFGYWMRAHSGFLLRLADEGIASFALDDRGIDIHVEVDVQPPGLARLEHVLALRSVRVHVHKLSYDLRRSKFSWLAWLLKPVMRPLMRHILQTQLSRAIADALHAANRELVFARERLRATRIADPDDLATFVRAVAARWTPEPDPDVYTRVGVDQPGKGVFKNVYAPGSVVKLWHDEAARAEERVEEQEFRPDGWRNGIFDVQAAGSLFT